MNSQTPPESSQNRVIAIVGMAGSGKSRAAQYFANKQFQVLRFGEVIDEGIKSEGLQWTPKNNAYYRTKIRKELGMAAVAIKMLPRIQQANKEQKNIILDGLYSWEEYLYLREHLPSIILLCVYARPSIRYERLAKRPERPFSREEAVRRDISEIEVTHKGGPIAFADYLIKNETTLEDFDKDLDVFYATIL